MNIIYTGKPNGLDDLQRKKLDARFAKIAKLLDGRGERQAHVILKAERRLTKAEITVHYQGHDLVGKAAEADAFQALVDATHKLEAQMLKTRHKQIDSKRGNGKPSAVEAAPAPAPAPAPKKAVSAKKRLYRPRVQTLAKPASAEEAILAVNPKAAYCVYQDADSGRSAVLVRRADGHFDLIET